ncbi:MAG: hypothetical protein IKD68_12075 [Solobacterium sp.]|nr:hypothetical protein [Solobacterium sp.]
MSKQILNEELLGQINGASNREIQELKNAILANPYLRREFLEMEETHPGSSDSSLVYEVIVRNMNMGEFELNEGNKPNNYREYNVNGNGRYYWHTQMVNMVKNYKK